jgi:hypothetical protein
MLELKKEIILPVPPETELRPKMNPDLKGFFSGFLEPECIIKQLIPFSY